MAEARGKLKEELDAGSNGKPFKHPRNTASAERFLKHHKRLQYWGTRPAKELREKCKTLDLSDIEPWIGAALSQFVMDDGLDGAEWDIPASEEAKPLNNYNTESAAMNVVAAVLKRRGFKKF
jgi:hypothetical protein